MVKRCPTCQQDAAKIRVRDVRHLPKQNVVLRTGVCPKCAKVILTREEVVLADRGSASLR